MTQLRREHVHSISGIDISLLSSKNGKLSVQRNASKEEHLSYISHHTDKINKLHVITSTLYTPPFILEKMYIQY